jgi:hypothetical protein
VSKAEVTTLTAAEIQQMLDVSPFNLFLGLTVVNADPVKQEVTMRTAMRPEFERRPGSKQWHGGVIASVIDTAGDFAVGMMVGRYRAGGGVAGAPRRQERRRRRRRCVRRERFVAGDREGHLFDAGCKITTIKNNEEWDRRRAAMRGRCDAIGEGAT